MILLSITIYFICFMNVSRIIFADLYASCQYVYMLISIEGFDAPKAIPRMKALSNALVREHIKVCEVMGGLG